MNKRQKKKLYKRFNYRKYSKYKSLMKLSKDISKMIKTTKYDFSQTTNDFGGLLTFKHNDNVTLHEKPARHPTEIECQKYLISYLDDLRSLSKISVCQYRTVKGQIRRGYIDIGMNFITNHSDISKQHLQDAYDNYKLSDIYEYEVVRKSEIPVKLTCAYATLNQNKE